MQQPEDDVTMGEFDKLKVGVLALQGDFERHAHQIRLVGGTPVEVRTVEQLSAVDGLIIPGGESTTMNLLLDRFGLREPLIRFAAGKPVWGTCAGMIMLSRHIADNQANVRPLGLIDIDVVRNGYGRQVFSFEEALEVDLGGERGRLSATFIRAPRVVRAGAGVIRLAEYGDSPVLVREGRVLASSFHTELDDDTRLLEYFLRNFLLSPPDSNIYS